MIELIYARTIANFRASFDKAVQISKSKNIRSEDGTINDIESLKVINEIEKYLETDLNLLRVILEAIPADLISQLSLTELL